MICFLLFFLLIRTSTLDDIYQHINSNGSTSGGTKNPPFRRIDGSNSNDESEYEEGTVTGYAVQHPVPSGFVRRPANHLNENENQESLLQQSIAGNKAGNISNQRANHCKDFKQSKTRICVFVFGNFVFWNNYYTYYIQNFSLTCRLFILSQSKSNFVKSTIFGLRLSTKLFTVPYQ